ncbi:MAG: hypothetical protein FJ410_05560 [Verrucomicrobia bacterium]|nr:hypothetical protein [Verrucomicrobiota bacterium]
MNKTAFLAACAMLLGLTPEARAFKMHTKLIPNQAIFGIQVEGTALSFYGQADSILSVSFQEYTTGPLIVAEVVIDMRGSNQQLRLYASRPTSTAYVADRANRASAANSVNRGLDPAAATRLAIPGPLSAIESKVNNMATETTAGVVVKTYPNTTHAKTVEMVVSSKEELIKFYSKLTCLYKGIPVSVSADGTTAEGANEANAAATAAGQSGALIRITRVGGVLFSLE